MTVRSCDRVPAQWDYDPQALPYTYFYDASRRRFTALSPALHEFLQNLIVASSRRVMNMEDIVKAIVTDPVLQQRLAKYLVLRCFRNSVLEDLHAGVSPSSKSGDYLDVEIRTPFGAIPWNKLSRFDDAEMKVLMIDVVNRTYQFIRELFDEEIGGRLLLQLAAQDPAPKWENPK